MIAARKKTPPAIEAEGVNNFDRLAKGRLRREIYSPF